MMMSIKYEMDDKKKHTHTHTLDAEFISNYFKWTTIIIVINYNQI